MKEKRLMDIIEVPILFISTAIIPNMLISIMQITINTALLSAAVASVVLLILLLIKKNLILSHENRRLKEIPKALEPHYDELKLYSINGRAWASYFEQSGIRVDHCIIFIRDNVGRLSDKERYDKEKEESIKCWKAMCAAGKIGTLIIYRYTHISDHYFAVLDDKVLITGLNNFNKLDSTGQSGDPSPKFIYRDEDPELIKKYKEHFENYVQFYLKNSKNKIYDSTKQG